MHTLIAFIRGINVSGHNIIKMEDLRAIFSDLGLKNIKTYLQSGNVVFDYESNDVKALTNIISDAISNKIGSKIELIILQTQQLKNMIDANPFVNAINFESNQMYLTFLSSNAKLENFELLLSNKKIEEQIILINNVIYIFCPEGYGKSKLTNNLIESKLKTIATTRNWKTVNEVLKIAIGK